MTNNHKLVFIILNQEEYLDELLEAFVEMDVRGATIIDSVGMGQIISHALPIFGGIRSLQQGSRPYNKTLFTVVPEAKVAEIIAAFEQICGHLADQGTGLVFTVPVDFVAGVPTEPLT